MKIFVFGSTGDLFKRKVIKALCEIKHLEVIALGRKELSHEEYFKETCPTCEEDIKKRTKYLPINFDERGIKCTGCKDNFSTSEINYFYIALPPEKIIETLKYIHSVKIGGHKVKVLIEKPLGSSLEEAGKIKDFIEKEKLQEDIFLADHYLFKENILKLRKESYNEIKIVSIEKVGVEKRAFYDEVGAINDMVQSHLLNVLEKIIGLEKMSRLSIKKVRIGQYKGYQNEIGNESITETYANIEFNLEGKEIIIETGKNFPKKEGYIEIDGRRIDLEEGKDAYLEMLEEFLENKKENFSTIEQAINCWKIVNEIKKVKSALEYY